MLFHLKCFSQNSGQHDEKLNARLDSSLQSSFRPGENSRSLTSFSHKYHKERHCPKSSYAVGGD